VKATTERQAARIALQEEEIKTLTASLKQQANQIQEVSAQLELRRSHPKSPNISGGSRAYEVLENSW
jgi:hypothetical protein